MLKKITLLAMALGALMAFVIPAAASAAPIWTVNGIKAGSTTAKGVTTVGTGTLSATTTLPNGLSIELGPCLVHMEGVLWNEGGTTATGEITKLEITSEHIVNGVDLCQVWTMTEPTGTTASTLCDITSASTSASVANPWHVDVASGATGMKITGANFLDHFNEGCALGPESGASGIATGTFVNGAPSKIEFNDDGDMEGSLANKVFLDGSVTVAGKGGQVITLDP